MCWHGRGIEVGDILDANLEHKELEEFAWPKRPTAMSRATERNNLACSSQLHPSLAPEEP